METGGHGQDLQQLWGRLLVGQRMMTVGSGMKQAGEVSNSADQLVQSLVWTDRQTGQLSGRQAGRFQLFRKLKNPLRNSFVNLSMKANVLKSGRLMKFQTVVPVTTGRCPTGRKDFTEGVLGGSGPVARLRLQLLHLLVDGHKGCRNLLQHLQLLRDTTQAEAPRGRPQPEEVPPTVTKVLRSCCVLWKTSASVLKLGRSLQQYARRSASYTRLKVAISCWRSPAATCRTPGEKGAGERPASSSRKSHWEQKTGRVTRRRRRSPVHQGSTPNLRLQLLESTTALLQEAADVCSFFSAGSTGGPAGRGEPSEREGGKEQQLSAASRQSQKEATLEGTWTLWTYLRREGQGSSAGVSMSESWDTDSAAHSWFSSTSGSLLDPGDGFEAGTKVSSCCRKPSCLWTLALAWTDVGP